MSCDCNITVQFEVRDKEVLSEIAKEHGARMAPLEGSEDFDRDARRLLDYMQKVGRGVALGPRGDMFTWGSLGNYSSIDYFVDALGPFWIDLYGRHALFDHSGIVVMFQQEQRPAGGIIEITPDRVEGHRPTSVTIRELETPFPLFGWHFERSDAALPSGVFMRRVERGEP